MTTKLNPLKNTIKPNQTKPMSNSSSIFLLLILTLTLTLTLLLPTALTLSQQKPIQALLKHLDSKRASPSVQEAAAKAVLKRLLPECYVPSFQFKIVPRVMSHFWPFVHTLNALLLLCFIWVSFNFCILVCCTVFLYAAFGSKR